MKLNYLIVFTFLLFVCTSHSAEQKWPKTIDIKEWQVPWDNTRPRDPAVDSKGNVWFCGQAGNYIAMLNPLNGKFKRFELSNNTNPHNLIIDSKDHVWYAGNRNGHIGRLNPTDGSIKQFSMPGDTPIDPHTLVFNSAENIWFSAQWGNKVGFLNTQTGEVKLVSMPFDSARPYGIKVDYDDIPWVVLFGSNKLAKINPESFTVEQIDLIDINERPRRLEVTQNNHIYYLDHSLGYLGSYNSATKKINRWLLPEEHKAKLYGSAIDSNDRIWIALTGVTPNQIRVFDSNSKQFIANVEVPSGAGSIRYMHYNMATKEVWFGTDANTIGRVKLH
ncbi:lyase [Thalassotalea psychrophila]|uniref:Lyase n=1 Tax=Thalassotalea psychrophila TaxID=3065647 RepID=A0ABY9TQY1_9GAMM|nr:lyase [Colwelliaceae bacterium SQ149]